MLLLEQLTLESIRLDLIPLGNRIPLVQKFHRPAGKEILFKALNLEDLANNAIHRHRPIAHAEPPIFANVSQAPVVQYVWACVPAVYAAGFQCCFCIHSISKTLTATIPVDTEEPH